MDQSLSNAFSVLIVGMVTVFFILWLVVTIGNLLIRITNRFEPVTLESKKAPPPISSNNGSIAAIIAAVDTITNGNGKVTKITKV